MKQAALLLWMQQLARAAATRLHGANIGCLVVLQLCWRCCCCDAVDDQPEAIMRPPRNKVIVVAAAVVIVATATAAVSSFGGGVRCAQRLQEGQLARGAQEVLARQKQRGHIA